MPVIKKQASSFYHRHAASTLEAREITTSSNQPQDSWPHSDLSTVKPKPPSGHLHHPVYDLVHDLLAIQLPVTRLPGLRVVAVTGSVEDDVPPLAVVKQGLHAAECDLFFDGSRQIVDSGEAQDDVVPEDDGKQFPISLVQLVVVGGEANVEANGE